MKAEVLILRLLIAHLLGDFIFQTELVVKDKKRNTWKSFWLYFHCILYAVFVYIAIGKWDHFYFIIPIVCLTHIMIDGFRSGLVDSPLLFIIDQFLHIVVIGLLFGFYSQNAVDIFADIANKIWTSPKILAVIGGFILVTLPFGRFTGYLTKNLREKLNNQDIEGIADAGLWIGCLERLFIYSLILTNHTEGIALLAAAKSIFRFGEIKDSAKRAQTEYILIGTLLSFALAMAAGYFVREVFLV